MPLALAFCSKNEIHPPRILLNFQIEIRSAECCLPCSHALELIVQYVDIRVESNESCRLPAQGPSLVLVFIPVACALIIYDGVQVSASMATVTLDTKHVAGPGRKATKGRKPPVTTELAHDDQSISSVST